MDWKRSGDNLDVNIAGEQLRINKSFEIPQADIAAFVTKMVDGILRTKQSSQLILPGDRRTSPENKKELHELIHFSFEQVTNAWRSIAQKSWIIIPDPKINIIENQDSHTWWNRPIWPSYHTETETVYIDPFYFEYFQAYVYPDTEDFTMCYVIAHEIAHHIQKHFFWETLVHYKHEWENHSRQLESVLDLKIFALLHHFDSAHQVEQIVELHADYLAWVAIHHANKQNPFLHADDIREGLETALLVWDDMRQYRGTGEITPHTFTHGRADQRVLAFWYGLHRWDPHKFPIETIAQLYFSKAVHQEPHETVQLFGS